MAESEKSEQEKSELEKMDDWRRRIDGIDLALVRLFNERTRCAIEIGHIKRRLALEIYSPGREAQVIANVIAANEGPLDPDAVRRLFERVIDEARRIERIHSAHPEPEAG